MANVYLSFLGTSDYVPCIYYRDGESFRCQDVRFVQEATTRLACSNWSSEDRILIFTTEEAYDKNWVNNGHVDSKTGERPARRGLKECLSRIKFSCSVTPVEIPEGKSEDEIWQIFNKVYENLNHGDQVIFDITHAFRSIPMLAIVVLNYAKVLKKINLKGVYYGAFEVLGSVREAEKIPLEKRLVPILDLTAFDMLMAWTFAIDRFIGSGDAGPVSVLAQASVKPILKETAGSDETAKAIRSIGKGLASFSKALTACRGPEISKMSKNLTKQISRCDGLPVPPAFLPLFNLLKEEMALFKGSSIDDGIQAAKWCLKHNLVQQAYTILQETLFCYMLRGIDGDENDLTGREIASQAIKINMEGIPDEKWYSPAGDNKETTHKFLEFLKTRQGFVKAMRDLTQFRNDLNHAGYGPSPMKSHKFPARLEALLCDIYDVTGE